MRKTTKPKPRLIGTMEVAALLHCHPMSVARYVKEKNFPKASQTLWPKLMGRSHCGDLPRQDDEAAASMTRSKATSAACAACAAASAACYSARDKCEAAFAEFKRHPTTATEAALEDAMAEFKVACVTLLVTVDEHLREQGI